MESKGLPQKRQRNVRTVTWMNLYTVKPFPDNDVVQTEGRLVRGRVRRVLRGLLWFDVGRCDAGDPRVFSRK